MIPFHFFCPEAKPITSIVSFRHNDGIGWTCGGTGWVASTQVAFGGGIGVRCREYRAEWASNGTEMATDTQRFTDHLAPGRIVDPDGVYRTSSHAPCFVTL